MLESQEMLDHIESIIDNKIMEAAEEITPEFEDLPTQIFFHTYIKLLAFKVYEITPNFENADEMMCSAMALAKHEFLKPQEE